MPISRTRDLLVDVARQLFARIGVENTTMNDIAVASQKGRRTLYTYFKSKNEVYMAVVETELQQLIQSLEEVANRNIRPDQKLTAFIFTRLEAVKETVFRNGTLRADFFRDIWRVEKVRKQFDIKEIELLRKILTDGVNEGVFEIPDVESMVMVLHYSLKGLDVPYIRGVFNEGGIERSQLKEDIIKLLFKGLLK
ncbi:TetR/AcrR family transcriptional regulator [Parabacteroides sp. FAFU027]|uniref:TetR/AcrR family transcriptional regulator n=1 Tax=Parabacteroides sp. FAFU027 TaxID=2922715 RepID=UPI001FB02264|nr:TetR/AcrR family transcriptional regulator [Parabacteroides sp. FAFU027]